MVQNSFYGGIRGISPVIKKRFNSEEEMAGLFSQGMSYQDVKIGESVLIQTPNKTDPTNGNWYIRGLDFEGEKGGAIFQGQLIGCEGSSPELFFCSLNDLENKISELPPDDRVDFVVKNASMQMSSGVEKREDGEIIGYNNDVKYSYCTIRDKNGNVKGCYIGFDVPKMEIDFEIESIPSSEMISVQRVEEPIDGVVPEYYRRFKINAPRGVKGRSVEDLVYDKDSSKLKVIYRDFSMSEEGRLESPVEIADIKNVQTITFDEETSKLKVEYSDIDEDTQKRRVELIDQPIKFIREVLIDEDEKRVKLIYSTYDGDDHEQEMIGEPIEFPINITIDPLYRRYKITYNTYMKNESNDFIMDSEGNKIHKIEWVGSVQRSVRDVVVDEDTKKLKIIYDNFVQAMDGEKPIFNEMGNPVYKTKDPSYVQTGNETLEEAETVFEREIELIGEPLRTIKKAFYDAENHVFKFEYNVEDSDGNTNFESEVFKCLDKIELDPESRKLKATYNTTEVEYISDPIENLEKVVLTDSSRLLAKYHVKKGNISYNGENDFVDLGVLRGNGLQVYATLNSDPSESMEDLKIRLENIFGDVLPSGYSIGVNGRGSSVYFIKDSITHQWEGIGDGAIGDSDFVVGGTIAPQNQRTNAVWGIVESKNTIDKKENILDGIKVKDSSGNYGDKIYIGSNTDYVTTFSDQTLTEEMLMGSESHTEISKTDGKTVINTVYEAKLSDGSWYEKNTVIEKKDGITEIVEKLLLVKQPNIEGESLIKKEIKKSSTKINNGNISKKFE